MRIIPIIKGCLCSHFIVILKFEDIINQFTQLLTAFMHAVPLIFEIVKKIIIQ